MSVFIICLACDYVPVTKTVTEHYKNSINICCMSEWVNFLIFSYSPPTHPLLQVKHHRDHLAYHGHFTEGETCQLEADSEGCLGTASYSCSRTLLPSMLPVPSFLPPSLVPWRYQQGAITWAQVTEGIVQRPFCFLFLSLGCLHLLSPSAPSVFSAASPPSSFLVCLPHWFAG